MLIASSAAYQPIEAPRGTWLHPLAPVNPSTCLTGYWGPPGSTRAGSRIVQRYARNGRLPERRLPRIGLDSRHELNWSASLTHTTDIIVISNTISHPSLRNPPRPADTLQQAFMPLIIPMSLHTMQHVGEAGRPASPLTPTVVKDDMSFPELCETLKDYCELPCSLVAC